MIWFMYDNQATNMEQRWINSDKKRKHSVVWHSARNGTQTARFVEHTYATHVCPGGREKQNQQTPINHGQLDEFSCELCCEFDHRKLLQNREITEAAQPYGKYYKRHVAIPGGHIIQVQILKISTSVQ